MRIGLVWRYGPGANYRAIGPLKAMHRRGHEVVWPLTEDGAPDPRRLAGCDVVHVYRRADQKTRSAMLQLMRGGTAFVYDNDDDYTTLPAQARKALGGLNAHKEFAATVSVARLASALTTTSEVIAARYRNAGVKRVEVIGNYLSTDVDLPLLRPDSGLVVGWKPVQNVLRPGREPHEGIVIGWVAAREHRIDANRLGIADVLRRVTEKHQGVRVECIGVDLRLGERYLHDPEVPFEELPRRIAGFDIGIAPLAEIPFNRARSDIKLKEYAACGVPWLASPVGPYRGLGEAQGGRLITDTDWFEALERLIVDHQEREQLGRNAREWAEQSTIDVVADRWERLFADAARAAAGEAVRSALGAAVGGAPAATAPIRTGRLPPGVTVQIPTRPAPSGTPRHR